MSWASVESRTRLIAEVAKNIQAFLDGVDRNVIN
jgi:lactate dehydrogenase-like 2-hydroxyacid dehydrogenase